MHISAIRLTFTLQEEQLLRSRAARRGPRRDPASHRLDHQGPVLAITHRDRRPGLFWQLCAPALPPHEGALGRPAHGNPPRTELPHPATRCETIIDRFPSRPLGVSPLWKLPPSA